MLKSVLYNQLVNETLIPALSYNPVDITANIKIHIGPLYLVKIMTENF